MNQFQMSVAGGDEITVYPPDGDDQVLLEIDDGLVASAFLDEGERRRLAEALLEGLN